MVKGVYGIVCILIVAYCLYIADKCRKEKKEMAKATAKVCLSGAVIVLFNSVTLFFNHPFIMSIGYCGMFICSNIFLYFLLEYTVQLTETGPIPKIFQILSWVFIVIDTILFVSNHWTNWVLEFKETIYFEEVFLNIVPKNWYYIHCIYVYLAILAVAVVLIIKCFRVPLVYAGRYLTELLAVAGVVILNLLFVITTIPVDLSSLLFGWVAWVAYRIAINDQPKYIRRHARYLMSNKLQEPIVLFDINNLLADFNDEAADKLDLKDADICNMTREYFENNILHMSYEEKLTSTVNREITVSKEYAVINYKVILQILKSQKGLDLGFMYVFQDVTKQKMMYNALEHMSAYDPLTGFYTNRSFVAKLEEWDKKPEEYIIAICNIAGLKLINAFYDRTVGNSVIQRMSEEIRNVLPEDSLVCYSDDDCTVIIAKGITENQMNLYLSNAARKLKKRGLDNVPIYMNFGIARRENTAVSIEEYIKYAVMDLLMKKGKDGESQKREMSIAWTEEYFNKEYESLEHVNRIKALAEKMADKLQLNSKDKIKLDLLCSYHDIGRVKTREEVWSRAAIITRDELDIIKLHSIAGYQIMSQMQLGEDITDLVLYHHENYDGSGYPYGISGEEIPLLSRILAIVDSYDIMVNDQLYKGAVSEEMAREELNRYAGTQFDPALVKLFETCLEERE